MINTKTIISHCHLNLQNAGTWKDDAKVSVTQIDANEVESVGNPILFRQLNLAAKN